MSKIATGIAGRLGARPSGRIPVGVSVAWACAVSTPLIAVADPNASTRELLSEVFRSELRAYVTTLASASDLGPMLRESRYDLVVIEISRDRLADAEAIRALKEAHRATPFLLLTAWGTDVELIEERVGADRVIAKPFALQEVIAAAAGLLDAGRPLDRPSRA